MEVESIRPVFGKYDSSDTKQDSAYGTLPLENSDQNTLKDNSFELKTHQKITVLNSYLPRMVKLQKFLRK